MPRPDRIMERNNNHNQNIGSGFILGVIVGVILTLLLTTKKGRAILKELMEKGVEKFADLEQIMQETQDDFEDLEDEEGNDFVASEPVEVQEKPQVKKEAPKEYVVESSAIEIKKETVTAKPAEEEPQKEEKVHEEKTPKKEPPEEEQPEEELKPKTVRGRRWFRGLRKKG